MDALDKDLRRVRRGRSFCTALAALAVVLSWVFALGVVAQIIAPGVTDGSVILQQDVLRSYQQTNEPFLLDDAATIMHCRGDAFDGTTLRCGKTNVSHRSVGPFSAGNSFAIPPAPGVASNPQAWGCVIFQPTTAGAGTIIDMTAGAAVGWSLTLSAGSNVVLTANWTGGACTATTAGAAAVNQQHVACFGYVNSTDSVFAQLDGGAVAVGACLGSYSGSPFDGVLGLNNAGAVPFLGTIAELWITAGAVGAAGAWNAATAASIATAVQAMTVPSPALPGLGGALGVAGDSATVFHCVGDDYNGGGWNCNPDRAKHTSVGSFSTGAEAPYGYLQLGAGADVLDLPAAGFTSCAVFDVPPTGFGATSVVIEAAGAANGWNMWYDNAAPPVLTCTYAAGGVVTNIAAPGGVVVGGTNVACCGRDAAGNNYAALNAGASLSGAGVYAPDAANPSLIGRSTGAASPNFGRVREIWASTTPFSGAPTIRAAALSATGNTTTPLTSAAADPRTVLWTTFDDWNGTSVTSRTNTGTAQWLTLGSVRSARNSNVWPATFSVLTGWLASVDAPFNWPSVAWTMVGAVPAARSSAGYPTGYGPERRQLGGLSDANNVTLAAASDALDLTQLTGCIVFYQGSVAAAETIYGNGTANVAGMYLTHGAGSAVMSFNMAGAAVTYTINGTITANADNVVCFGRGADANLRLAVNNGAAVAAVAAAAPVAGTGQQAYLGRATAAGSGAVNTRLKEFWMSSTPASDAFVTQQAGATLRCNTPGACVPEDANTLMHCTVDIGWSTSGASGLRCSVNKGNQPWTTVGAPTITSASYSWAYGTTGVDREGAGVYTDANYFSGPQVTPLDFNVNGWEACAVFKYDTIPTTNPFVLFNATGAADGWDMEILNAGTFQCRVHSGGGIGTAVTANAAATNGLNIGCCGYDGANVKAKLNGGATATAARAYVVPGAVTPLIGRGVGAGNAFTTGRVYEVWASNTVFTEADIAARQARFMNLYAGSYGEVETFTRATTSSTTDPDGNVSYVPASMPVNEKPGLLGFSQRTNVALQSEAFDVIATWVPTNLACAANTTQAPDGQTTAETCTDNANNTAHEVVQAYVATAAAWTVSAYARAGTLGFVHLSPDNANFTWFNLATCAPATNAAGNTAVAYLSVPVAGVAYCRVGVTRTMGAGAANASIGVSAADATRIYIGAGGTAMLWGGQIEAGAYMGPYIPTTNIAVQRNADAPITFVNPLTGNTDFCFEGDFTPFGNRGWGVNQTYPISIGAFTAANTALLSFEIGPVVAWRVYDSGGVVKSAIAANAFVAGSTHKIRVCSLGGILTMYYDGVQQAPAIAGLGTGIISTMPATISYNVTNIRGTDGCIKNIVVDPPLLQGSEVSLRQPLNLNDPVDLTFAGVPAPSLDCRGSQYTGGATWPCTGGTGNKVGGATSGNGSPYYPSGFGGTREPSAFFNSATPDYFDFGDVLDPTGSFSGYVVFRTNTIAAGAATLLVKDDVGANRQFALFRNGASVLLNVCKAAGVCSTHTIGTVVANEWNIAAFSYVYVADGSSIIRSNLNGVAPAETANAVGPPVNLAAPLRMGWANAGYPGFSGYIAREGFWQTSAFTAAQLAQIVSLLQTGVALPITNSRTGIATITPVVTAATPSMFNASARTPRVGTAGVLSEGARTNYAWPSEDLTHARWVSSPGMAVLANQGTFPDGNVTMDRLTSTLNTDTTLQTVLSANSTTFSASGWIRSNAGSTIESIIGACPAANNVTACACNTNTGLACTAAINPGALNECYAYSTVTTTPIRIWVNFTCTAATTAPAIGFHDGQYLATATIVGMFGGAQLEVGTYPTTYIPTSAATQARVADANASTNLLRDPQTRWCAQAVATPENSRTWAGTGSILHVGSNLAAANTASIRLVGANIVGSVYDSAAALRSVTWAHGYAAGSTHTLWLCSNAGVLSLWSDRANTGAAPAGAGTGIISAQPAALQLGYDSGGNQFDGWVQYADLCANADPTRCW